MWTLLGWQDENGVFTSTSSGSSQCISHTDPITGEMVWGKNATSVHFPPAIYFLTLFFYIVPNMNKGVKQLLPITIIITASLPGPA